MENTLEILNKYFMLLNLKAFCEHYELNYEFTRQVLQGRRPLTEKFKNILIDDLRSYHESQQEIFNSMV
ncbi:MAG: hypothetical protein ACOH1X_02910 [Kaistella sp.]